MKKQLLALGAALIMAGCSSTQAPPTASQCTFPDAPEVSAPMWICSAPVEGVAVSAVGSQKVGGAGIGFAKQQAAAKARAELAQMVKVQVDSMFKQFVETTGTVDDETVDQVASSVIKQISSETLVGSRVYLTQTSPNNTLYVLMGLDELSAQKIAETALKTSMQNEGAMWQKFQAGKALDEMAAEISQLSAR